jgi:hypothetical protein
VSRVCEEGGEWQNVTDYTSCVPLGLNNTQETDEGLGVTIHVYFFGYCLSLTALILAMIIFIAFKYVRNFSLLFSWSYKDTSNRLFLIFNKIAHSLSYGKWETLFTKIMRGILKLWTGILIL